MLSMAGADAADAADADAGADAADADAADAAGADAVAVTFLFSSLFVTWLCFTGMALTIYVPYKTIRL